MILRAGLVQLRSGRDMARNLADAAGLIRQAAGQGAALVATPEMTNILEPDRPRLRGLAKVQAEDESVAGFSALAAELGIWLNIGSLALMGDDGTLINRSLLFDPAGTLRAYYDKIHLFDVDLPTGESLRESHAYSGGSRAVVLDAAGYRLGLTICYDVRFPGLLPTPGAGRCRGDYRALGLHCPNWRSPLACAAAGPGDRNRKLRSCGRAGWPS